MGDAPLLETERVDLCGSARMQDLQQTVEAGGIRHWGGLLMLVSLIVYEPAAFQLSRDGVIKQMGCDAVEHKPDDPRDPARRLAALRAALPRQEDAKNRNSVAAAGMERMARCPAKRARH
jgi:hypothetical protein